MVWKPQHIVRMQFQRQCIYSLGDTEFPHAFEAKALQYEAVDVLSSLAFKIFSGFLLFTPVSITLLNYPYENKPHTSGM